MKGKNGQRHLKVGRIQFITESRIPLRKNEQIPTKYPQETDLALGYFTITSILFQEAFFSIAFFLLSLFKKSPESRNKKENELVSLSNVL